MITVYLFSVILWGRDWLTGEVKGHEFKLWASDRTDAHAMALSVASVLMAKPHIQTIFLNTNDKGETISREI